MLHKRGVFKNFSRFTDKHKKQSSAGVLSKNVLKNFAKLTEKHFCGSLFFNKVAGWKPETVRSSHWRCFVEIGVLQNFANFTRKHLRWSLFLIRLQLIRAQHRCFTVKFAKFLRTTILKNICKRLLLNFI